MRAPDAPKGAGAPPRKRGEVAFEK